MFLKETRASFLQSLRPALMISCVTSVGLVPVARTLCMPSLHPAYFIFFSGQDGSYTIFVAKPGNKEAEQMITGFKPKTFTGLYQPVECDTREYSGALYSSTR